MHEFGKHKTNPQGRQSYCRVCLDEYLVIKRYGMRPEEYNRLLDEQDHACAICREQCITKARLAVDHDHKTGRVRALLCDRCNKGLGLFRDDSWLLVAAAEYLKKFSPDSSTDGKEAS